MDDKEIRRISQRLAKVLRHDPAWAGLTLNKYGCWASVADLISGFKKKGFLLTKSELDVVVHKNDKHRFEYDATRTKIRARQGHTVECENFSPKIPPERLYHGTGETTLDSILKGGLLRLARLHVHLTADIRTATEVGARHGKPVVLAIDARQMSKDGFVFGLTPNRVWLVEHVPPHYIKVMEEAAQPNKA